MSEHGHEFEGLKKLLKLKRHEIPPPGYFNDFSAEVISRIRAGGSTNAGSFAERLNEQAPWLVNFIRLFEAKPAVIGAFAISLCLLLLFGVVLAEHSDSAPQAILTTVASSQAQQPLASSAVQVTPDASAFALASDGGIAVSTNASLQPVATLFGQPNAASLFQTASFTPAGN